jgi:hypothetical protein
MSKSVKILVLVVAILATVYIVFLSKPWSTIKGELKDFAIKDTAAITQFFLADKRGNKVTLTKNESGVWMVNNQYEADVTKVNLLLATMHEVTIRNPIPESAFNTVVAAMATDAVKAEFYEGNTIVKTIYVGSSTPDQTGTFMMIEGSSTPFVTHIQGFVGYLTPRFFPISIKWKGRKVFNTPFEKIASLSIVYPDQPQHSFTLKNNPLSLSNTSGKVIPIVDEKYAKFYLSGFEQLYFEGYDEEIKGAKADSIKSATPYCMIELADIAGNKTKLQVNFKNVDSRTRSPYDENGKLLGHDTEKYYAFINDEKDVVYIQHYNFGRVFKSLSDFTVMH